ncbi:MAG: tyrosine-protein phosphatase [Bacteroidota bacterium]
MKKICSVLIVTILLLTCKQNQIETTDAQESNYQIDSLALVMNIDTLLLEKRRHLQLDGSANFRDLGGIQTKSDQTIRWNKIFRADKLSELTTSDFKKINEKGIKTVIDFRTQGEVEKEPDTLPTNIAYLHFPVGEDKWSKGDFMKEMKKMTADTMEAFMVKLYTEIPLKWSNQYKRYFETLMDSTHVPLVFHCTAGKDRTGIGSALLLYVLGVDMQTIKKEYELSNYYRHEVNNQLVKTFQQYGLSEEVMRPLVGVKGSYLETIFETITAQYGSLDYYLEHQLGVNAAAKTTLRTLYLE